ncbi:MAG TPA: DUF4440 domain-containing protein [Burkholderiaceae bacterium]|nr:DUF4440 domain-containing protein [Burkholderiaceae bacterium]
MRILVAMVLSLLACSVLAADRSAELVQLVATEREFAARAQQVNARQAFVEYFAADAIVFDPFAGPAFPALREGPDWNVNIQWRPVAAGISGAGDMGYTTGPSEYRRSPSDPPSRHGHYTSVWRRQSDGRYRVLIDAGIHHPAPAVHAVDWSLHEAPATASVLGAGDQAAAVAALRELDARTGAAAGRSAASALAGVIADDARLHHDGSEPAVGRSAILALIGANGQALEWVPEGAAVAASGDFGFVYGRGRWQRRGASASGELSYLNVWQQRAGEWKLVVHVSTAVPEAPR